jgi:hypothetical protein
MAIKWSVHLYDDDDDDDDDDDRDDRDDGTLWMSFSSV